MFEKYHPACLIADQNETLTDVRAAILSDLHIGSPDSEYNHTWRWLMRAISRGEFNTLIINGDFCDYRYVGEKNSASDAQKLTSRLYGRLDQAMSANPHLHVYMVRGNHDIVDLFKHTLSHFQRKYPKRFFTSDILLMGKDAVFIHGDKMLRQCGRPVISSHDIKQTESYEKRHNGLFGTVATTLENVKTIDNMLAYYLEGDRYNAIKHVFAAHTHPNQPVTGHVFKDKQFHITNPPFKGAEQTVMKLEFNKGGTAKDPVVIKTVDTIAPIDSGKKPIAAAKGERKYTPGVDTLTVIPIGVIRKMFPDSVNLNQPYLLDDDVLMFNVLPPLKKSLIQRGNLTSEVCTSGVVCINPEIISYTFPNKGRTPCLILSAVAQDKLRNAGIQLNVIETVPAAEEVLSPSGLYRGYTMQ